MPRRNYPKKKKFRSKYYNKVEEKRHEVKPHDITGSKEAKLLKELRRKKWEN